MPFTPLTEEQFNKARQSGFSPEKITEFELKRKSESQPAEQPGYFGRIGQSIKDTGNTLLQNSDEALTAFKQGNYPEVARKGFQSVTGVASAPFSAISELPGVHSLPDPIKNIGTGVTLGAASGSVVPGVGTAVGGLIGGTLAAGYELKNLAGEYISGTDTYKNLQKTNPNIASGLALPNDMVDTGFSAYGLKGLGKGSIELIKNPKQTLTSVYNKTTKPLVDYAKKTPGRLYDSAENLIFNDKSLADTEYSASHKKLNETIGVSKADQSMDANPARSILSNGLLDESLRKGDLGVEDLLSRVDNKIKTVSTQRDYIDYVNRKTGIDITESIEGLNKTIKEFSQLNTSGDNPFSPLLRNLEVVRNSVLKPKFDVNGIVTSYTNPIFNPAQLTQLKQFVGELGRYDTPETQGAATYARELYRSLNDQYVKAVPDNALNNKTIQDLTSAQTPLRNTILKNKRTAKGAKSIADTNLPLFSVRGAVSASKTLMSVFSKATEFDKGISSVRNFESKAPTIKNKTGFTLTDAKRLEDSGMVSKPPLFNKYNKEIESSKNIERSKKITDQINSELEAKKRATDKERLNFIQAREKIKSIERDSNLKKKGSLIEALNKQKEKLLKERQKQKLELEKTKRETRLLVEKEKTLREKEKTLRAELKIKKK